MRMRSSARRALLVLGWVALVVPAQAHYEYEYDDAFKEKIICSKGKTLENALVSADTRNFDGEVFIESCPPPAVSYATVLTSRFNITAVDRLTHRYMPPEPPLQSTHFTGLALSVLTIDYASHVTPDTSFLDFITCGTVSLYYVNLPPLPQSARIEVVKLTYGKSLGAWGGCFNLGKVELYKWNLELVPERWLAHCPKLTSLRIYMSPQMTPQVLNRVLRGATSLRELKIDNCELEKIDIELADLVNLQSLDLSFNPLWNISVSALPVSLASLYLWYNQLWSSAQVAEVLQQLPALQELSVAQNPELDLCEVSRVESRPHRPRLQHLVLPSIERLEAAGTATHRLCFGAMQTDSLTSLDLSGNQITALKFRDLPVTKAPRLELNMEGNPLREVVLEQADYEMLRNKVVVMGIELSLACDCEHIWLARAVRDGCVLIENLQCSDGTKFGKELPERVQCDNFTCAESACTCRRSWRDNATVARCAAGALRAVPRIPGLRALHAAGNRVRTFSTDDLPESLLLLDLAGNNVSRADAAAAAALFARPERRVRLARNPLRCDCGNRALLAALKEHRTQVEDYDNMTCLNEEGLELVLRDVEIAALCTEQPWLTLALAGGAALVGLAALVTALYYRYGRLVAVYMFTRGWCLNCVREEELDPDRPFDAFVSFAHADEEFVTQHLLPGLESEPHNYRLCVHIRDWVPGEEIPTQIALSVRLSQRTIIVLSQNFLQSVWGLLEFRMAHVSALSEGRVRVVVVVLDDVLDEGGLDPELHAYLRMHTYVQWGDPWFWRKLRYALPHRRTRMQCARTDGAQATAHGEMLDRNPEVELLGLPERENQN